MLRRVFNQFIASTCIVGNLLPKNKTNIHDIIITDDFVHSFNGKCPHIVFRIDEGDNLNYTVRGLILNDISKADTKELYNTNEYKVIYNIIYNNKLVNTLALSKQPFRVSIYKDWHDNCRMVNVVDLLSN